MFHVKQLDDNDVTQLEGADNNDKQETNSSRTRRTIG